MKIVDIHERKMDGPVDPGLIDGLAARGDRLWPYERWPAMRFDRPLGVGATGGHGPIRYRVAEYEPGRRVVFEFLGPRGLTGTHALVAEDTLLRHEMYAEARGPMLLGWPLVFKPLHCALVEDALAKAAGVPAPPWSRRVRLLRKALERV